MKKKPKVKTVNLPDNLLAAADGLSNFNGAVNWLLRQLITKPDMQKELEIATGITFSLKSITSLTPSNVEQAPTEQQANVVIIDDWKVDA